MVTFLLLGACEVSDDAQPLEQPTLLGKWKFVSHVVSDCTNSVDNQEDRCSGTAADCGVLTIGENTWLWQQTLSDGSVSTESGSYTVSTNTILLTGSTTPGTKSYSISGSAFSYTRTTLTFINTSDSDGCTYTQTFSKYSQPGVPPS
jgi:hypothetical protein